MNHYPKNPFIKRIKVPPNPLIINPNLRKNGQINNDLLLSTNDYRLILKINTNLRKKTTFIMKID